LAAEQLASEVRRAARGRAEAELAGVGFREPNSGPRRDFTGSDGCTTIISGERAKISVTPLKSRVVRS